jgi:DNA-binding response OmpR family regulator
MRAIIADDSSRASEYLRRILRDEGHEVVKVFDDGDGVVEACKELKPDFVVLDISMRNVSGITVANELLDWPHHPFVIMASSLAQGATARPLIDRGATFISKPYGQLFALRLKEALDVPAGRAAHRIAPG